MLLGVTLSHYSRNFEGLQDEGLGNRERGALDPRCPKARHLEHPLRDRGEMRGSGGPSYSRAGVRRYDAGACCTLIG